MEDSGSNELIGVVICNYLALNGRWNSFFVILHKLYLTGLIAGDFVVVPAGCSN